MLMNTLAILRGNFRPLSLTTSTCVNLHKDLYRYLERALSPTCEHYNVNVQPSQDFGVLSVTFNHYHWLLRLASMFKDTYHYFESALSPTCEHYNVSESFEVLSVTFDHYRWLLHLASIFIVTYTITWNARYRQLVNTIMLINTLAILRGTFGNFRPLSLTTLTCVNLHRDLYH